MYESRQNRYTATGDQQESPLTPEGTPLQSPNRRLKGQYGFFVLGRKRKSKLPKTNPKANPLLSILQHNGSPTPPRLGLLNKYLCSASDFSNIGFCRLGLLGKCLCSPRTSRKLVGSASDFSNIVFVQPRTSRQLGGTLKDFFVISVQLCLVTF